MEMAALWRSSTLERSSVVRGTLEIEHLGDRALWRSSTLEIEHCGEAALWRSSTVEKRHCVNRVRLTDVIYSPFEANKII